MAMFIEENGRYGLDASEAEWATDCIHERFQQAHTNLSDVDFVVYFGVSQWRFCVQKDDTKQTERNASVWTAGSV